MLTKAGEFKPNRNLAAYDFRMREHEAILDALRRRAGSELADILFQHLRNKRTAAVEHLGGVSKRAIAEATEG